jgi:transposase-like protein
MAITKEVLDELLKDCNSPDGLVKQLSKALIERMMQVELTEQFGYSKNEPGEKETENRRNGKTSKTLRTDQGPMEIEPKVIPKHQREWRGFFNR